VRSFPWLAGRWSALTVAAFLMAGAACSGSKVTTQTSVELQRYQIRTIALMPFTTLATPQVKDAVDMYLSTPQSVRRSDISLGVPPNVEAPLKQTATVPAYAAGKITQLFWTRLKTRQGLTVLPPSDTVKAAARMSRETDNSTPERQTATLAAALKVDAALMGQVLVYQERSGSRLGASPPATVGFEVKVVAPDGQILWVGNYYERQQPMTQDLVGYIQHGGVFVTAEELAEYGVEKVLKTFPFGSNEGE
jgi:hypothetical protein